VRYFWHVLEPDTALVDGWPLAAMSEHLEAVTRGDINRLLITLVVDYPEEGESDDKLTTASRQGEKTSARGH
jgi:hypothetical protein